jgi:DNA-3-methyladenine glycosylase II
VALLALPQPYDFVLSTERFRAFGRDFANLWVEDSDGTGGLHRVVAGREVRIEPAQGGVAVEPLDEETRPVVERLLGVPFELEPFVAFAASDRQLAHIVPALAGFRPPLAPDPFEALVTSITAQQVSLFAAFAIRNRLIAHFGERAEHAYSFPTRDVLAAAEPANLVALGFSNRKAEYVVSLARSELELDALAALPDQEVKARIVALRGLGDWTADWFLARHLGRPQAWPASDLGLRKAVAAFYGEEDVAAVGARLDPFQNLAAHYLLTGLRVL